MNIKGNFSPLRYPGGKSVLNKWMEELFIQNNLVGGTYAEPYVGGAGVALFLLFNNLAEKITYSEQNIKQRDQVSDLKKYYSLLEIKD